MYIEDPGAVQWVDGGGLVVTSDTMVTSPASASKIIAACKQSNELTVEAWIKSASINQYGPARIVSMSSDPSTVVTLP